MQEALAALPTTLLQCLGKEEQIIHQNKIEGPIYYLNQAFILELTALDQLPLKKEKLEEILDSKVELSFKLAPKILGGIIIKIDNKMFDASLASKFNYLTNAVQEQIALL